MPSTRWPSIGETDSTLSRSASTDARSRLGQRSVLAANAMRSPPIVTAPPPRCNG